ncbi:tumor necrosis factor receptor superfamily member 13B isoform X2 [Dunckerocampus dactyliophorus]|uniref:tumor necrosis factor receptor superfamily member 13B isoform X2 n=1 Tax=Dunckerocampus dactyliophorus TaxID=161453 RepID=UPI0024052063|nr:tumor necrosis factor receptor superfamily member 13B isoform X2 [Dunckerocampus dactyliophorus]
MSRTQVQVSAPMGATCPTGQYWDSLVKKCVPCKIMCQQPLVITRCSNYCVLADCKTLPGHYYDGLLRKCVTCADVCGRHPAECSQHCNNLSVPVTTKNFLVKVTSHLPNSKGLSAEDSTVLIYSLLVVCLGLLLSSLSFALVVFLRGSRARTILHRELVAKRGQGVGQRGPKDCVAHPSGAADESIPTETSVCVHCFPDFTAVGSDNKKPHRAPLMHYQQDVLNHARMQHQCPPRAQGRSHTPTLEVHEGLMVG